MLPSKAGNGSGLCRLTLPLEARMKGPCGCVINIARHIHGPALDLMYLGRLSRLATYFAAGHLALRMIPGLKLLLSRWR